MRLDEGKEGDAGMNLEMPKEKCPRCGSENVTITDCIDDETGEKIETLWDGKCKDCGYTYILFDY